MNLTDRLRSVVGRPGSTDVLVPTSVDPAMSPGGSAVHASFCSPDPPHTGEWRGLPGEQYLVIDRTYPPGHRHGHMAVVDAAPGQEGGWPVLSILEPALSGARLLFLDLETTGLAGGAGTYAFLVGCGWFDNGTFRVRQFLLASFAAERRLLEELADTIAAAGAIVTYNGKTFDLPLLETRFLFHRLSARFPVTPHVDLLHTARRLWRSIEPQREWASDAPQVTCCLGAVERSVLGHVRDDDVPGYAVPARYFQYVRTGDARQLAPVLEHNRLDLLSLALLTSRAAQLLDGGAPAARTAREALGLGRLYQRAGMLMEARVCFARAAELTSPADSMTLSEALRSAAVVSRRTRQHDAAVVAWRALLELPVCPPRFVHEASEALAIHHEHHERDLRRARDLAYLSLQAASSQSRFKAVEHRLARLDRKLATRALIQPLF